MELRLTNMYMYAVTLITAPMELYTIHGCGKHQGAVGPVGYEHFFRERLCMAQLELLREG